MENEIWKPIKDYEGIYEVSNYGNIKSFHLGKEKILSNNLNQRGYYQIFLYKDKQKIVKRVHQLVAIEFLNHTICGHKLVVNHKDFNKTNNHIDNLEIVTQRENSNQKQFKSTSQYVGVGWDKPSNKWRSRIRIQGKLIHLGLFTNEIDASELYQKTLSDYLNEKEK